MAERIEALVIGAGAVGLAIGRALALSGIEVAVIDRGSNIGTETSSRNSEVVHAGIYYPSGSLKARLCVEGRHLLYEFCERQGVAFRRLGKLIVAAEASELPRLHNIAQAAKANGVDDIRYLDAGEVRDLEPEVRCLAALISPSTGILDSAGYMAALRMDAETHGAMIALRTTFMSAARAGREFLAKLRGPDGEVYEIRCSSIVNAAGHGAHDVARSIDGVVADRLPPRFLAKGSYCSVSGPSPFGHLIYPLPVPGALGIHVTIDLQGTVRLGPNIEWTDQINYAVDPAIAPLFAAACYRFWPALAARSVHPSYCGIRPKVHDPDQGFADFIIEGPAQHGASGLVNLFGIESPGLTASLAIGNHVIALLRSIN